MGAQAYMNKGSIQHELVPLVLMMIYKKLSRPGNSGEAAQEAIDVLDDLKISNEMFKEHLLDLNLNKAVNQNFERIDSGKKAAFTRAYNALHKDPTARKTGTGGKKSGTKDATADDDSDEEDAALIDEEEQADIRKAKKVEKQKEAALEADKLDTADFTMI